MPARHDRVLPLPAQADDALATLATLAVIAALATLAAVVGCLRLSLRFGLAFDHGGLDGGLIK